MVLAVECVDEVASGDSLGEGLLWDHRTGEFIWTDILGQRLHRYHLATRRLATRELPDRLCSFALSVRPDVIVAAFARGLARFDTQSGALDWLHRPELPEGVRFNDGRTDPAGRFWVGTMVEDAEAAGGTDRGQMFCLHRDGRLSRHFSGFHISNGLCWSPDARTLYHADSPARRVSRHGFDPDTGTPGPALAFLQLPEGRYPDGAVTDAQGRYWCAVWEGSAVRGFDADGAPVGEVGVPTPLVTCPAFGGAELDMLAVTTAHGELDPGRRAVEPSAGNLFIFRGVGTGRESVPFAGWV